MYDTVLGLFIHVLVKYGKKSTTFFTKEGANHVCGMKAERNSS